VLPGVTREARCVDLARPEDPDAPNGRAITVRAAVVPATGLRPLPDAIFVFAGGPGQSATEIAGMVMPLFARLEARRDVVFVDQRGTGASNPLRCLDDSRRPLRDTLDVEKGRRELVACRDGFTDAGTDLSQYATWTAMRDVEAVRQALGYGRINLWGASYGTRAALEYARQFPQSVRTVVIDGVAPALTPLPLDLAFDTDAALARVLAGDGGAGVRAALELVLADDAGVQRVTDPFFGDTFETRLDRKQRLGMVRAPLYVPMLTAALPHAIVRASEGDWTPLIGLQGAMSSGRLYASMHFSVLCAEDMPRITDADREAVKATLSGTTFIEEYERSCAGWPTRAVPREVFAPPTFDAPTLLLSGGADPVTPPHHAEAVAKTLPRALHLVAPNLGHGVSTQGCGPSLVTKFITAGSTEGLDGGCLTTIPPPDRFEPPRPAEVPR
jgi:pimeloyl-ACP methyl ester carboxylesterase